MTIAAPSLTPESELILRCSSLDEPAEGDALPSLLSRVSDWTTVLSLAQRHGVVGLVDRALRGSTLGREATLAGVPFDVAGVLERWSARVTARHARLRAARDQLLERFAASGVAVIPLRCARLPRSHVDLIEVDVLVRRHDVAAASRMLIAGGLEPEAMTGVEPRWGSRFSPYARRFLHPGGDVISLQWGVADDGVVHGASIDELWSRGSSLDHADFVQLLCVRGTIKRWQRLSWIREVADVVAEAKPGEVEDALDRATRAGSRRALALGTSLAGRLLGAPVPLGFTDATRDPVVAELGRLVAADVTAPTRSLPGPWDIARFHLRSRERAGDQVRYALRRATLPAPEDVAALGLPPGLDVLAYPLAPLRRAARAGEQWIRRTFGGRGKLARFGRTPPHVVDRMLALLGATPADVLFDLGCGDGAIVIRAAQRVGCRGVGVDVDPALVDAARANARAAGVEPLVEFRHGDVREMDLSEPTIVSVYLNAAGNLTLRPHLQRGLRPGTRLVCYNFAMGDWIPDAVETLDETAWGSNTLYVWHIAPRPAATAAA